MPFQSKKKSRYKQVKISRETFINQYIMSMNTGFKYIAVLIRNDEEIKPDIHIIMDENQEERFKNYLDDYDSSLREKKNKANRIVGITAFDEFRENAISPSMLR
jgi:hypothetical protein